jgi:hypothetical protein
MTYMVRFFMPRGRGHFFNFLGASMILYCKKCISGEKVQLGPGRGKNLGMVWRNRKKISHIINDYLYLPFFHLTISRCPP